MDAIRWCLGEQKSSTLRSDKMENVIFNGTADRKATGMAEVSLTIKNNRGVLPTEYDEVTITRRIFRSGESEYLLNKNICRLKDITNLFMDTGMASNAYSVIELKMVEQILNNKADDRRQMFEEAAGVNKYKHRRRTTLKKLEEVKGELNRVRDIVSEVEKKVASLERQAKKADKANSLKQVVTELEFAIAEREIALLTRNEKVWKEERETLVEKRKENDRSLAECERESADIRAKLSVIEGALKDKRNALALLTEKIYKEEQGISVSEEAKKSLTRQIQRHTTEIEELKDQLAYAEESVEEAREKEGLLEAEIEKLTKELQSSSEAVEAQRQSIEAQRQSAKQAEQKSFEIYKNLTSLKNDLEKAKAEHERVETGIRKRNEQIQQLTGTMAKSVGFIADLNDEKTDAENRLKDANHLYAVKQKEKEELEVRIQNLRSEAMEKKSAFTAVEQRITFLQDLLNSLEGLSTGTKTLYEDDSWKGKEFPLLAGVVNSREQYRFAIEASLKANLNAILITAFEDLNYAVGLLRDKNAGKATFYLQRRATEMKKTLSERFSDFLHSRRRKKLAVEAGFLAWAEQEIDADDRWKPLLHEIISGTVIIDTLEHALALYSRYPEFSFATLQGDYISKQGFIDGGAIPRADDTIFGRRQLLKDLLASLPAMEQEYQAVNNAVSETEQLLTQIDLKVLAEKEKLLYNEVGSIEKQIAQFEFEKNKTAEEIEKVRSDLQQLVSRTSVLETTLTQLSESVEKRDADRAAAESEREALQTAFLGAEKEFSELSSRVNTLRITIERKLGEKKNTENERRRNADSIITIQQTIQKRNTEIANANEEVQTLTYKIEEHDDALFDLRESRDVQKRALEAVETEYNDTRSSIEGFDKRLKVLRQEHDDINSTVHRIDLKVNEAVINSNNLRNNIRHKYDQEIELKEFEDLDMFDFIGKKNELNQLEKQLLNLGPVNSLAYEEYAEEKERLDLMQGQEKDLIESEKDLMRAIMEIDTTAKQLFMDTFEQIRANFIKIFRGLFNPGDEADLRLEEGADPLEGKIEIIAKPKGKRPTSIELLSGGEKTLTAIALLFAIYLVKPSPFCILDEIDAPLDDANVDRFTKIIREFSHNTQFIIVTHNKRTMEAADVLYGVTMQEEGVSKLVSVKFNEDLNLVS